MSIILNEQLWAERVLKDMMIDCKPSEGLRRMARYYNYLKLPKREIKRKLEDFVLMCDPRNSVVLWSDSIDRAIKQALKNPISLVDYIPITQVEMDKIASLKEAQAKRLAFTLLCVAKYYYTINPQTNYWVSTPDSELMRMANIATSIKHQSALFRTLKDEGLIDFSKRVDNLSVRVNFVSDDEEVIHITDFRNLGYQYQKYYGGDFYVCQICGITEKNRNKKAGRRRKYCEECAMKIKVKQNIDSVMRIRTAAV